MTFGWAACALALALAQACGAKFAASPSPTEAITSQQQRIAGLIEQLGDKDFSRREKAQSELAKIGFDALDALYAATDHDDLEIAERARLLMKTLRVEWVAESDSVVVKSILRNYEEMAPEDRVRVMSRLARLSQGAGLEALCRLVRYEKSLALSKQAALHVLSIPDPPDEAWPKRAKLLAKSLGGCERSGAKWLVTLAKTKADPEGALAEWERHVAVEKGAAEGLRQISSEPYLVAMMRREILLLKALQRHDQSRAVVQQLIQFEKGNPATLIDLLEWLSMHKSWDLIDEVAQRFSKQIHSDVMLLYTLADVQRARGQIEEAEKLAETAFRLDREKSPGPHVEAAMRLWQKGRFEWMEREYKEFTNVVSARSDLLQARWMYASFLHDQGRDKAAADLLSEFAQKRSLLRNNQNQAIPDNFMEKLSARKQYYLACSLEAEKKTAEALKELKKGLASDESDANILIAMWRLSKGNEKEFNAVAANIHALSKRLRDEINEWPDDSVNYNQLAWLLANTDGDADEALQLSLKSLDLKPGEAGYIDTLAHCYFAKGDLENAVAQQSRAVELEPYSGLLQKSLERFKTAHDRATKEKAAAEKGTPGGK